MEHIKVDNYTKGILTIIAVCLAIMTLKELDFIPRSYAGESTVPTNAPSANYGFIPLNDDGSITVKLSPFDVMDVKIVGISTFDELNVNIKEVGGGFISIGGPIPVKIK